MSSVETTTAGYYVGAPSRGSKRGLAEPALVQVDPPGPRCRFSIVPQISHRQGGGGIWAVRLHPRQDATWEWEGRDPETLLLDAVFSATVSGRPIEPELDALHLMHRGVAGGEPGRVRLTFGRWQHVRWIVQALEWTEVDYAGDAREYARALITLGAWRERQLALTPVEQAAQEAGETAEDAAPERTYTVRAGDTLSGIAARELGSASRWREIWDLNREQIPDPNVIRPGMVLKLPPA